MFARVKSIPILLLSSHLLFGCEGKVLPPKGELMLVVTTDMQAPKDFDAIRVTVSTFGTVRYDSDNVRVGREPGHVTFPATLGVVTGSDPSQPVTIRVTSSKNGVVRTLREVVTTIPIDRVATLYVPIEWLCFDQVKTSSAGEVTSSCGVGKTCVSGSCTMTTVDSSTLNDYTAPAVFGGGDGTGPGSCFDTVACFASGQEMPVDLGDCSMAKVAASQVGTGVSVAMVLEPGTQGICGPAACLVPIDAEPTTGWSLDGNRIQLPSAVCERLNSGEAKAVAITTSCAAKTPSLPTCGDWSSVNTTAATVDAGAPISLGTGGVASNGGTSSSETTAAISGGVTSTGGTFIVGGTTGTAGTTSIGGVTSAIIGGAANTGGAVSNTATVAAGGTTSVGGMASNGGSGYAGNGLGGTGPASGGTWSSDHSSASSSGGYTTSGGSVNAGGSPATGGRAAGGATSGGTTGSGGTIATGGTTLTAGATGGGGGGTIFPCDNLPAALGSNDVPKPVGTAGNLSVINWAGYQGAVSYTLDDANTSQTDNYTALNALGVRFTFYLVTSSSNITNPLWLQAVKDGHELGNHTHTHSTTISATEIDQATTYIEQHFGVTPYSFAAPNGASGWATYAKTRFLIDRSAKNGLILPNDGTDQWELPCFLVPAAAKATDSEGLNYQVDTAESGGGWRVILTHGFTGDAYAYQPMDVGEFVAAINHAKSLTNMWIDTVAHIGAYWVGQTLITNAASTTSGSDTTWTWDWPSIYPPHSCVRVTVDGGTLTQNGTAVNWDPHGYYVVSLDAGSLTLSP